MAGSIADTQVNEIVRSRAHTDRQIEMIVRIERLDVGGLRERERGNDTMTTIEIESSRYLSSYRGSEPSISISR